MDVFAGSVVSSIESATMSMYHSVLAFFNMSPKSDDEGFVHGKSGYPLDKSLYVTGKGEGADDAYNMYRPYLRKTEFSSREQHDNHRWPTSREMTGPHEQSLRKNIVLPCNYPTPGLSKTTYANFA
jgi:hypothetical protein